MEILHSNNSKNGKFYIEENGEQLAEMTYVWAGDQKFIIDHTDVDERLKGQGVGKKLVLAAVDYARAQKVSILPLCPFAKATFEKNADLGDVLA